MTTPVDPKRIGGALLPASEAPPAPATDAPAPLPAAPDLPAAAAAAAAAALQALEAGVTPASPSIEQRLAELEGILASSNPDLSGRDLRGIPLKGLNLDYAILDQTKLDRQQVLYIIKNRQRRLPKGGTDFRNVDLSGADLSLLDLRRVNFVGANLHHTNLRGAELAKAVFSIDGLQAVLVSGSRKWPDGYHDFKDVHLQALEDSSAQKANLYGLDFSSVDLSRATLLGFWDLTACRLGTVRFGRVAFGSPPLKDPEKEALLARNETTQLKGRAQKRLEAEREERLDPVRLVKLGAENVVDLVQSGTCLDTDGWHDLRYTSFAGADLTGLDLNGSRLWGTDISAEQLASMPLATRHKAEIFLSQMGADNWGTITVKQIYRRLLPFAQAFDLAEGFMLFSLLPVGRQVQIDRLRKLAEDVNTLKEGNPYGRFRKDIHGDNGRQSVALIDKEIAYFRSKHPDSRAIPLLLEMKDLAKVIYESGFDFNEIERSLSGRLLSELAWPDSVMPHLDPVRGTFSPILKKQETVFSLEELGRLALSVRHVFNQNKMGLTLEERHGLMRLAIMCDHLAFGLCGLQKGEEGTAIQAQKMATLLRVMIGCGFGDEGWVRVAELFDDLATTWETRSGSKNLKLLKRYGILAATILEAVQEMHHDVFDRIIYDHQKELKLDERKQALFTSNLTRTKGFFRLADHVEKLKSSPTAPEVSREILRLMATARNAGYDPFFIQDGPLQASPIDIGGKPLGLVELAQLALEYPGLFEVPEGFVLPPSQAGNWSQELIATYLRALERITRLSLEEGTLKVSVRSGGPVSMPGLMDTVVDVASWEEMLAAISHVFASWHNARAVTFRNQVGMPETWGTSATIQKMVDGTRDSLSGAGLAASDPESKNSMLYVFGKQKKGVDLVSDRAGKSDPLPNVEIEIKLVKIISLLEQRKKYPVEIEFVVESGKLYVLQCRRAKLPLGQLIRWILSKKETGLITYDEALALAGGRKFLKESLTVRTVKATQMPLITGLTAGGRDISGPIILQRPGGGFHGNEILVTGDADTTSTAMAALETGSVVFAGNNPLSHLNGVSRTANLNFIGGVPLMVHEGKVYIEGDIVLEEGETITIDPAKKAIYRGELEIEVIRNPDADLILELLEPEKKILKSRRRTSSGRYRAVIAGQAVKHAEGIPSSGFVAVRTPTRLVLPTSMRGKVSITPSLPTTRGYWASLQKHMPHFGIRPNMFGKMPIPHAH